MSKCDLDRQREALGALQRSALDWWEQKRPSKWDLRDHLNDPEIDTCGEQERALALAVAKAIEIGAL